ncbi:hypothetical protein [Streptomyces sp. WM6386]|uniref:hypothetical protein n=1 Tax=Streptomyces sp. WM6386 TaxID=1415558 RepID=UPI0006196016|nr:hypothetical protein [Streptomyces sp. WM6386]KKD04233.1 hypothetical protein TN53_30885 [Streptomyces sp. WM6386]
MTASGPVVTADEIHAYLVGQLNRALRHPEGYGGELALVLLHQHLLFAEGQADAWGEASERLRESGAWTAVGARGAYRELIRGDDSSGMASVHAEFAHRRGWLATDRVLDARAHQALLDRARQWAGDDRVWADVLAEFGAPSVLLGDDDQRFGKTLGYVSEDPDRPIVFFHLWNGSLDEDAPVGNRAYPEPVLWAVRFGDGPFRESFTFTPEGRRLQPS